MGPGLAEGTAYPGLPSCAMEEPESVVGEKEDWNTSYAGSHIE